MAKITIQLSDEQHARFVNAKMRRKSRSLQALMIAATERLLGDPAEAIAISGYRSSTKFDASEVTDVPGHSGVHSESLQISQREEPWVRKLLDVLRSERPSLITALQHNLRAFNWAKHAAARADALESTGLPVGTATPSGRRRAAAPIAHPLPGGGVGIGTAMPEDEIDEAIDALEKDQTESRKAKKRPTEKAR